MTSLGRHGSRWSFAIDRGGTFTDVVAITPNGETLSLKLPSASAGYDDAGVEAMRRLLGARADAPFPAESIADIRVGTTVATNALLERAGARTLFVTTRGFADGLIVGDQTRPDLFALNIRKPAPLYAGVLEADERLAADGAVVRPLDDAALCAALEAAVAEGFESAAVAFMHGDLNPEHEARAAAIAREAGFGHVSVGHEVSPLPRFLPRAETTVADAYLTPVLRDYVRRLTHAVGGASLYFMTSAGGLVRGAAFRGRDAVLSGPAGGAVGVGRVASLAGAGAVLGLDMGGTSTDVCRFAGTLERRAGARVAGVALRAPMLDVETVAAGGGSILAFDGLRARVGPRSAGAEPGPAAYGRGGPATVTDANLVLGRLDVGGFAPMFGPAGDAPLDPAASRARLSELAVAMGAPDPETAAEGFIAVAVEQTAGAIGRVSTERGFDPRDHALVAYGGAAGQMACQVAEALGVREILCPRFASVLSAWGIGQARLRAAREAGLDRPLGPADLAEAAMLGERLAGLALGDLAAQGSAQGDLTLSMGVRYEESDTVLSVPLSLLAEAEGAFNGAHRRLFGFTEPGQGRRIVSVSAEALAPQTGAAPHESHLPGLAAPVEGPRLIVLRDTQIWLAPGWRAEAAGQGTIRLVRIADAAAAIRTGGDVDPVTLELYNRRFMGVAEAMGAALERTARSVNIKERLDFSCALFDAGGGLVANAPHMPVHLGSMGASVRAVLARHPRPREGDAFALNNPYVGGTHLPDITVVMPVFSALTTAPAFFVAARGHHADVGGVQPGSMPPFSRTLAEEGVLLDALPILKGGRFLEAEVLAALSAGPWPCRSPDRNVGDLKAQIAACRAGAAAVSAMISIHGADEVARYMAFVQANAAASVRRAIGALGDGQARLQMDGGGEIAVAITVDRARGEATLDFSGSSAQLGSNFNAPAAIVDAACLYVFRTLVDDDIPLNAGCLQPLTIKVTPGSMLDPVPPGAVVAGNVETSQHLVDALYEALGVMAGAQGTMNNFTFGDQDQQYYETLCGGAGATAASDGASAVHTHMTNSRMTDPEILERRFAVRVERFAVRRGSGGGGRRSGGDGVVRTIRFLAPVDVALLSTRREHAPRGADGGGAGRRGAQRLIGADGAVKELPGCFAIRVRAGDAIEIETPGGGGFGADEPPATPT